MRTVHVEEPDSSHSMLWLAAGAILGVAAGVMLADRIKGRKGSLRSLAGRGRQLASDAMSFLGPFLDRDDEEADEPDEELDDEEVVDAEYDDDEDDEDDEADADDALDARVMEAFINDPILMDRPVEIEERDGGVIILHGQMRSAREAKHAVTIAGGVPGVERVRTRLTVRERSR